MAYYTFKEILSYFSEKLNSFPPKEDIEKGEAELIVDTLHVLLSKGKLEGSLHFSIVLGLLLYPIAEARLKELAISNFLGMNTGGCTLSFDETGISLLLHAHTTCGTSPQENWEWLHRLLSIAREWIKLLALWEEFVPLSTQISEEKKDETKGRSTFRA
jgi:hypothetical protein